MRYFKVSFTSKVMNNSQVSSFVYSILEYTRRMLRYAPRFHKNFPQRNSPKIIFTIFFFNSEKFP
jgi:hypothetical protein